MDPILPNPVEVRIRSKMFHADVLPLLLPKPPPLCGDESKRPEAFLGWLQMQLQRGLLPCHWLQGAPTGVGIMSGGLTGFICVSL